MKELIEQLRNCNSWYGCHSSAANICGNAQITAMCKDAADAIEKLQAELKQTKRERDAAVADINCGCICVVCKYEKDCKMANPLCDEEEPCHFEWRGVQEDKQ